MKVLCLNEGLVSNFELLELLRQRTHEPGHVAKYPQPHDPFPTELQCYEALRKTAAGLQTKARMQSFLKAVKPIALTAAECLNLMNLKPTSDVEVHLLVEDCEERLADDEVNDLLRIVAELL
mmetsp:Transcript_38601/g.95736  ORF Transcript_38601/g.95736 Transcript_38601/m.95736 type:complete len:122 (+) Transcript_38601:239-604(+)|eukprot:CAMPEP_0197612438 /NCGR_PEP_ID=MMETSP1326-20131121/57312_1 /TAXON_ID=1155430 /ORGANISM="Genus nov. species nov., Strain RCC2288" /LENGTH=121 /DNA_ID=CAMNT_0043181199 /DNA_START=231 /DNA_END=596 /DNA_ORIENTATION=-